MWSVFEKNHKMLCVPLTHFAVPLTLLPKCNKFVIASVAWQSPGRDTGHRVKAMMRCFCLSAKAMLPSARYVPLTRFGFIFVIPSGNTRDPKRYFCTFGEKAHTSIRVSVIACDNAISKVQCATHLPEGHHIIKPTQDTLYLRGEMWRKKNTPESVFLKIVLFCRVIFRRIH